MKKKRRPKYRVTDKDLHEVIQTIIKKQLGKAKYQDNKNPAFKGWTFEEHLQKKDRERALYAVALSSISLYLDGTFPPEYFVEFLKEDWKLDNLTIGVVAHELDKISKKRGRVL